jgi:Domain of unknown function (DUF1929)
MPWRGSIAPFRWPNGKGSFSGHFGPLEETGWIHFNANDLELFSPPYLPCGTRPTITSAPERIVYGTIFNVATSDARVIGWVCLIRQSSTTYQINTDQRYVGLSIQSARPDGNLILQAPLLQAPPDGGVAPPGLYMLVVTRDGAPSIAKWVRLGPAEGGIG